MFIQVCCHINLSSLKCCDILHLQVYLTNIIRPQLKNRPNSIFIILNASRSLSGPVVLSGLPLADLTLPKESCDVLLVPMMQLLGRVEQTAERRCEVNKWKTGNVSLLCPLQQLMVFGQGCTSLNSICFGLPCLIYGTQIILVPKW